LKYNGFEGAEIMGGYLNYPIPLGTLKIAPKAGRGHQRPRAAAASLHAHAAGSVAALETPSGMLPTMALPDGFQWTTHSASHTDAAPSVIQCGGVWVATLYRRVDTGVWMVALDRNRHGPDGPARICSSYEQGCTGAEMWVARHDARLRAEVGEINCHREAVRGNRLTKGNTDTPIDWHG
jgi:hypothetical protein